jgi:protein-S-isoprenylcysteine O-methyltransferase Ste14
VQRDGDHIRGTAAGVNPRRFFHAHAAGEMPAAQRFCKKGNPMSRLIALLYGLASYALFCVTFLYAVGFVTDLVVPKTIDSGAAVPLAEALIVNLLLMSLFAIQHSVMARQQFKRWWTQFVPKSVERSTYVLFASLALVLLFWQWRPMPAIVWEIADPAIAAAVTGLSLVGFVIVLTSTFLINHFELFGLHQVANNLTGRTMPNARFRTPLYYKFVRHPIYLGFIIAFWAAPTMTVGHLLFAAVTTAYIFVGIFLEERDLVDLFGDEYRRYKERVSMLFPWRKAAQSFPVRNEHDAIAALKLGEASRARPGS